MLKKSFTDAFTVQRAAFFSGVSQFVFLTLTLLVTSQAYGALSPFLSTGGLNIKNNYGQGDVVPLRGVNLGSWLLMESWMCPMDSSGLADNYSVIQTLDNRFGVATEQSLIKTYQNTWITTNDLDNIKALGMDYIRMPFWWGDVETLSGSWRADAFAQMDWLVTNAWQRGIYTLIDFHGVVGGQSSSQDTGQQNQNLYWTSTADQVQTAMIWSNVAAHFNGNPAVLGYDVINEPSGAPSQAALWSAYNSLYQTIRAVDHNHIIVMEGCWSGTGAGGVQLNWQWDVLPPPTQYGWTNVVYSMHAYPGGAPTDEVNKQVSDFNSHQSWNVPCLIGEFNWEDNTPSDWQYGTQQFNANNMNWSHWAYKATSGGVPNSWGIYDPVGTWPPVPNIQSDSINTISNDWIRWKTGSAFGTTSFLVQYLGAPLAVADFYTNDSGGSLVVNSNSGVLANDQDINLGQPGISLTAVLVSNPANGQLVLNSNGSFTYTPNAGFTGTDTFRYQDFDGFTESANIVTVSVYVTNNTVAGPVTQLIWTTQPGLATNGISFGQQPVLQTADASGNPSTNSLPASLIVTVTQSAGTGPLVGATNFNLGTAGSNGVVTFAGLQINSSGAGNQLTASVLTGTFISLLTNGNFNSPNSASTPANWTTWTVGGSGYANHEIVTANLTNGSAIPPPNNTGNYDGTYEMSLGATAADGSGGGVYQIVGGSQNVPFTLIVDAGAQAWWLPTGQIRLIFLNASSVGLETNVVDTTDSLHNSSNGGLGDIYDIGVPWQEWSNSAVSPAGTTQVKVEFAGYGGGTCWFDNAVLLESSALIAATTLPFTVYPPASQTNAVLNMTDNKNGTFTLKFVGTIGVTYCVQMTTNLSLPVYWLTLAGSTNTVTNSNGSWYYVTTNSAPQSYFRSAVAN
jgi:endoglucanase